MTACAAAVSISAQSASAWKLLWSDEFNGAAGQLPDPTKWTYDVGFDCCGNNEIETYTNSPNNVFQDGHGNLVIRALKDSSGNYTSGRIKTEGLFQFTYGRVESRIKLPYGEGVWPAFWMLGADITSVSWPQCGEVDIMENFGPAGNDISTNNGSLHGPGYTGALVGAPYTLPYGQTVSDDYHVYAIEWSPNSMRYYVDGALYETQTPSTIPAGSQWVFNNSPFFLILNQAIAGPDTGSFVGTPNSTTPFPSDLVVDYVRVYQTSTVSATTPVITPGQIQNAASYLGTMAPGSIAQLSGTNLAGGTSSTTNSSGAGALPTGVDGVSVTVSGVKAPLIFVSPTQIYFQIPWETSPSPTVNIQVNRSGTLSNVEPVMIQAATSPSVFIGNYTTGTVFVTNCDNNKCTMWGNGFGPKKTASQDGVATPAAPSSLTSIETKNTCTLTIANLPATVNYCGAAPGSIIDQIVFTYPSGLSTGAPYYEAALTIGGMTGYFRIPAQ